MRKFITFIILLILISVMLVPLVHSNGGSIDNDTLEKLIRDSFNLYVNLYIDSSNIVDKKWPITNSSGTKYYPGIGDYATVEALNNLKSSLYTKELQDIIYKTNGYKKYDKLYYYINDYIKETYTLPEKLMENIDIVSNENGKAYVIFAYVKYNRNEDMIYVERMGLYFTNTEKGWRISGLNYVPKHFDRLPISNSDKITEDEAKILIKNAFKMAHFTRWLSLDLVGYNLTDKYIENRFGERFDVGSSGFEKYEDWLNIASNIFTENKINPVFELANDRYWLREDDDVYVHFGVPQSDRLKLPYENCKLVANGNGKALAEVKLQYNFDSCDGEIQILDLTMELEKTKDGWRISGGTYYDYLFIDRSLTDPNPETDDKLNLMLFITVVMSMSIIKRKLKYV